MNDSCAKKNVLYSITLAISCALVGACSSGSSTAPVDSGPAVSGQAVDGYIVGGRTFCDSVEKTATEAAGRYSCPSGTEIIKVIGGVDVGYDETATTSDVSYNGVLLGPATYDYITPITTLATEIAGGEDNYDSSKLDASIAKIQQALNISSLDLTKSPAADIEMARLSAQLHLIVGAFSSSRDEYEKVMTSFADLVEDKADSNETININGSNETKFTQTIQDLVQILEVQHSELEIVNDESTDIDDVIVVVLNDVNDIEQATEPSDIEPRPTFADQALAFYTGQGIVIFTDQNDNTFTYSVAQYEDDSLNNQNEHTAVLGTGIKSISLDKSMIQVKKTLTNTSVDVAFSIDALDSEKELNVIAKDLKLSMVKDDSSSIDVKIPDGTIWEVEGVTEDGTSTVVMVEKDGDRIFSSSADGINLDFDYVADELEKKGHPDLTQETGSFRVTCVISGIELARLTGSTKKRARIYFVETEDSLLGGRGLRGFMTVK